MAVGNNLADPNFSGNESRGFGFKKWIIVGIIFVFVVILISVIMIFINGGSDEGNEDLEEENVVLVDDNIIEEINNAAESSGLTVKSCLEEDFVGGCEELFINEDIGEVCEGLDGLNDDCYFNAASINLDVSFCDKISKSSEKEDCNSLIAVALL